MQPLDLNLASNPFRNNTLLWTGYTTATLALLAFSVWSATTLVEHRSRLRELRDTVGTFESQRLDLSTRGQRAIDGIRRFDIDALEIQAAKANEVIEWKAFSWTGLFNALEQVQPNQVRMTGVRPIFSVAPSEAEQAERDGSGIPVALEGVAHDLDAFTELQTAMQEDESFGRVEPDRLIRTEAGEIAFEMHAWYLLFEAEPAAGTPQVPETAEPAGEKAADATEAAEVPGPAPEVASVAPLAPPQDAAAAAGPEVVEPWRQGEPAGSGEVESAEAPTPAPRKRPAAKALRGGIR